MTISPLLGEKINNRIKKVDSNGCSKSDFVVLYEVGSLTRVLKLYHLSYSAPYPLYWTK